MYYIISGDISFIVVKKELIDVLPSNILTNVISPQPDWETLQNRDSTEPNFNTLIIQGVEHFFFWSMHENI